MSSESLIDEISSRTSSMARVGPAAWVGRLTPVCVTTAPPPAVYRVSLADAKTRTVRPAAYGDKR